MRGMTDISPMWRIRALTEVFGPSGIGWKTEIMDMQTAPGVDGEMMCFIIINLYYKENADSPDSIWSEPIPGIGGSFLVASESKGLRADDEAWKKAYTDAISVACKALGIGANVYWNGDPDNKSATIAPESIDVTPPSPPEILSVNATAISQEQLTSVVQWKWSQYERGTSEANAFISMIVSVIGDKNYLNVTDPQKRFNLYKAIKEMK